jgi:hypothetical protein
MFDLSLVTDTLKSLLTGAVSASPIWVGGPPSLSFSGVNPELVKSSSECDLNVFLYHVTEDKFQKNSFWSQAAQSGGAPPHQPVAFEPMALDLSYLVSAASVSYETEQRVMSIVLRTLHENATITVPAPGPTGLPVTELTIALQSQTGDELSRLWQAIAAPLRMTADYRVSVVFLTPETPPASAPHPTTWSLLADSPATNPPTVTPAGPLPVLIGTFRRVTYVAPPQPGLPPNRTFDLTPASAAPAPAAADQTMVLRGTHLDDADRIYLVTIDPAGTLSEVDVTSWKVKLTIKYSSPPAGGVPVRLRPPPGAGAAPAGCPAPGHYYLRVGTPADPAWRSGLVALDLAAWVDPAPGPDLIAGGGGVYTCTVVGLPAAGGEVRLGTVPLVQTAASPPAAGEWNLTGTTLSFKAPAGLRPGSYALRVRAGDVESDPALWPVVP